VFGLEKEHMGPGFEPEPFIQHGITDTAYKILPWDQLIKDPNIQTLSAWVSITAIAIDMKHS